MLSGRMNLIAAGRADLALMQVGVALVEVGVVIPALELIVQIKENASAQALGPTRRGDLQTELRPPVLAQPRVSRHEVLGEELAQVIMGQDVVGKRQPPVARPGLPPSKGHGAEIGRAVLGVEIPFPFYLQRVPAAASLVQRPLEHERGVQDEIVAGFEGVAVGMKAELEVLDLGLRVFENVVVVVGRELGRQVQTLSAVGPRVTSAADHENPR